MLKPEGRLQTAHWCAHAGKKVKAPSTAESHREGSTNRVTANGNGGVASKKGQQQSKQQPQRKQRPEQQQQPQNKKQGNQQVQEDELVKLRYRQLALLKRLSGVEKRVSKAEGLGEAGTQDGAASDRASAVASSSAATAAPVKGKGAAAAVKEGERDLPCWQCLPMTSVQEVRVMGLSLFAACAWHAFHSAVLHWVTGLLSRCRER